MMNVEMKVRLAILAAAACAGEGVALSFNAWADGWVDGFDRSAEAARAALAHVAGPRTAAGVCRDAIHAAQLFAGGHEDAARRVADAAYKGARNLAAYDRDLAASLDASERECEALA
jgi:hypothetical protein